MAKGTKIEWRLIPGWPAYRINQKGDIESRWGNGGRKRKMVDTWRSVVGDLASGYRRVTLYGENNKKQRFLVHRLVLSVFVGGCPDGMEALHANGNRLDCRIENLRWGTPHQNWEDRRAHGRTNPTRGSKSASAKLSEEQIIAIRLSKRGYGTGKFLAELYQVSEATISLIRSGKTWRM